MSFTFLSNDLLQMNVMSQTFQALHILPMNALNKLENHAVSGAFSPVHRQNMLTQNGRI